jgi:peptidoglycan/xylan/chitin deacetylase (PgdA/CDA1 family)
MSALANSVISNGYKYYDWNVSSGDGGNGNTNSVYNNVIKGIKKYNVSIVLQHDSKGYSVDAVERIILWGLSNGYTFLPLDLSSPTCAHRPNN